MALIGLTNDEKIWNYFLDKGMSKYGIAGLLGNLDCESALNPKNLQDTYERSLGYTDETYTAAVDSGMYARFVNDSAGFGLAQWTWWTRKQNLQLFAKSRGVSIGDLQMQLDFLYKELTENHQNVLSTLMNARSVREASNSFLLGFECPYDQSVTMQDRRCSVGQKYYDKLANKGAGNMQAFTPTISPINGYYRYKKGSRIQLSKNFWSYEFDCHGTGCCTETIISAKLVAYCQQIRDHFGTSVSISSPYRCPVHNGGTKNAATGSRHTKGDAADIVVSNHSPRDVAAYCESIGILGIGLYETQSDGFFVHIDVRDYKSFWYGQACAARTTFGGTQTTVSAQKQPAQQTQASTTITALSCGSKGAAVKDLQEKLIKLGHSVGACGADGEFGYGTSLAVKDFQKSCGLIQDGIAGEKTIVAINEAIAKIETKEYVVTASVLNVRAGAGTNFKIVKTVNKNTILKISEINNGWGKMESGWVSMQYVQQKG